MGLRCLTVRVSDREVRHLIRTGYLSLESSEGFGLSPKTAEEFVRSFVADRMMRRG